MTLPSAGSNPKQTWRQYSAKLKENPVPETDLMTIGLAGSFTVDPLIPYLGGQLLQKGFLNPDFVVGPYNQIYQVCFNGSASLGKDQLDSIIILWRIEDLVPDLLNEALAGQQGAVEALYEELDRLLDAIRVLRSKYNGRLIVSTPPYPSMSSFDVHDLQQPFTGSVLYSKILCRCIESLNSIERVKILDLNGLLMKAGYEASYDVRKWYLYKQPYTEAFWAMIGNQLGRIIASETISAKKCIVVDCDNTIWGGIIGEDGLSGIELSEDFPGSTFRDFQKYLKQMRSKGTMLAVASKNNEEDVYQVFDTHDAMVLSREHISAFQVHWNSKVESLKNIAKSLNIGTDALVFVDDNPKEIAEVRERLPEVSCFLVPEDTVFLPDLLRSTDLFDVAVVTEEDHKRADMMKAETKRKEMSQELSEEEFIKSLDLKIRIFEAEPKHLARVTQLINKTNQFNLTTVRRSQEEVEALATANDAHIFAMDITDRFGEYGLVGVAIIKDQQNNDWLIDTLLMSCRVLGRNAETSFIAKMAEAVKTYGGNRLFGQYRSSKKNMMVKNLYQDHGFKYDQAHDHWVISVDAAKQPQSVDVSLKLLNP